MSGHPPTGSKQPAGSLVGIKVVDLSRVLAGPYCTQLLADHGAEVIKIEPPGGDESRNWGPPFKDGEGAYYVGVNRNKRGMALDLSREEGRQVVLRLLEDADILIENFKTGTMEKWGLGYESMLQERFPRLIYCQITGYGNEGPMGGLVGYDSAIQAYSGIMGTNGERGAAPLRVGMPIVDLTTGMLGFSGILLALVERQRSGRGQRVELCLLDSALSILHPHIANWAMDGRRPRRTGNVHPSVAPYEVFAAADGPIFIGAGNNTQFLKLCTYLGKPELAHDERYRTNAERIANLDTLSAALAEPLKERSAQQTATELLQLGIPAAPILEVPEVMQQSQVQQRKMLVEMGEYRGAGIPIKLSRTPGSVYATPPHVGEHSRAILQDHGFSPEEIDELIASGTVLEKIRETG